MMAREVLTPQDREDIKSVYGEDVFKYYSEDQIMSFAEVWQTEFRNVSIEKTELTPGELTTITGQLWAKVWGTWNTIKEGKEVMLKVADTKVTTEKTDSDGKVSFNYQAPYTEGSRILSLYYDGQWNLGSCESRDIGITVEKEQPNGGNGGETTQPFWKTTEGKVAIGGTVFLASSVIIAKVGGSD